MVEFVHFLCTSEDINNLAYSLMVKEFTEEFYVKILNDLIELMASKALSTADNAMLGRTHGQPATPTTLGKEISNFTYRLIKLRNKLR